MGTSLIKENILVKQSPYVMFREFTNGFEKLFEGKPIYLSEEKAFREIKEILRKRNSSTYFSYKSVLEDKGFDVPEFNKILLSVLNKRTLDDLNRNMFFSALSCFRDLSHFYLQRGYV